MENKNILHINLDNIFSYHHSHTRLIINRSKFTNTNESEQINVKFKNTTSNEIEKILNKDNDKIAPNHIKLYFYSKKDYRHAYIIIKELIDDDIIYVKEKNNMRSIIAFDNNFLFKLNDDNKKFLIYKLIELLKNIFKENLGGDHKIFTQTFFNIEIRDFIEYHDDSDKIENFEYFILSINTLFDNLLIYDDDTPADLILELQKDFKNLFRFVNNYNIITIKDLLTLNKYFK